MDYFKTKVIEIFGLPKTGKTTAVNALKKHLKNKGYQVEVVKERASFSPIKDKLHPSFNYWTAISFMKEYIEANDKNIDFLIADRGIFDSYVWINFLSQKIKEPQYLELFMRIANQDVILNNYLLTFYFKSTIDKSLNREKERQIKYKEGRIMNQKILNEYLESYIEIKNKLTSISSITEIDTTTLSIPIVLETISNKIEEVIK
jgi:thymidylate kinase